MTDREPTPPIHQEGRISNVVRVGLRGLRRPVTAIGSAVVSGAVDIVRDIGDNSREWLSGEAAQQPPPSDLPFQRVADWVERRGAGEIIDDPLESRPWDGPEGYIRPSQVNAVFAAALKRGGRIPDTVRMSDSDRAIVTGALAVMGCPSAVARYGSSMADRRAAGLTGPRSGTSRKEQIWLPSERTLAVSLTRGVNVPALVVAAELFEHKRPNTMARKGAATAQRLAHRHPGESELVRNADEKALLETANKLLLEVYGVNPQGNSQERNTPGSVAPLLLAVAVEIAGARSMDSEVTAQLTKHYDQVWKANKVHHASYPPELKSLAKSVLHTEIRIRQGGRLRARQLAQQQSIPLTDKLIASVTDRYRAEAEAGLLAEAAAGYATDRKEQLAQARLERQRRFEAERVAQERADRLGEETRDARQAYARMVLSDAQDVQRIGQQAIKDRSPDVVLQAYTALYEQGRVDAPGAVAAYGEFLDALADTGEGIDMLVDHIYGRTGIIADGFVTPAEAIFAHTVNPDYLAPHVRKKLAAIKLALQESTFKDRIIESNTGEGDGVRSDTVEARHVGLYGKSAREVMSIVKAGLDTTQAMRSVDWRTLTPGQLELLTCLHAKRINLLLNEAANIELTEQDKRGLQYELSVLEQWKRDVKSAETMVSQRPSQPQEAEAPAPETLDVTQELAEYTQNVFKRLSERIPDNSNSLLIKLKRFDQEHNQASTEELQDTLNEVEDRLLYLLETVDTIHPSEALELAFDNLTVPKEDLAQMYKELREENPAMSTRQLREGLQQKMQQQAARDVEQPQGEQSPIDLLADQPAEVLIDPVSEQKTDPLAEGGSANQATIATISEQLLRCAQELPEAMIAPVQDEVVAAMALFSGDSEVKEQALAALNAAHQNLTDALAHIGNGQSGIGAYLQTLNGGTPATNTTRNVAYYDNTSQTASELQSAITALDQTSRGLRDTLSLLLETSVGAGEQGASQMGIAAEAFERVTTLFDETTNYLTHAQSLVGAHRAAQEREREERRRKSTGSSEPTQQG